MVTSSKEQSARRTAAIRAGWNDAAWGRPRRELRGGPGEQLAAAYEYGYQGGLVARGHRKMAHAVPTPPGQDLLRGQADPA